MKEPTANDYRDAATHVRKSGRGCVRCQDAADLLDRAADAMQPGDDLAVGAPPLLPVGTLVEIIGPVKHGDCDDMGTVGVISDQGYMDNHGGNRHPTCYCVSPPGRWFPYASVTPYIPRYLAKGTTYGETTGEWRITDGKLEVEVKVNSITDHSIYGQCAYWPLADCRWLADDALEVK